jgi:ribosomal protein S1
MTSKNGWKGLIGIGLLFITIAGTLGAQESSRVISLTAQELYEAYSSNPVAAEEEYTGRRVRVTGSIRSISNNSVTLEARGSFMGVTLYFKRSERSKVARMEKGQRVTGTGFAEESLGVNVREVVFE